MLVVTSILREKQEGADEVRFLDDEE